MGSLKKTALSFGVLLGLSGLGLGGLGCKGCSQTLSPSRASSTSTATPPPKVDLERVVLPLLSVLGTCDINHRGQLVDMGTPMMVGRVGHLVGAPLPESLEHDGATWASISSKKTDISFTLTEPTPVFAAARIFTHSAKQVSFYIDDQPLGTLRLNRGEAAKVVQTGATALPVDAGLHTLSMHFGPGRKGESMAEVDWVKLGVPDDLEVTYGAPTLSDIVSQSASVGKVPHRSLSLRGPASVRCAVHVPKQGRLRMNLGMLGSGEAEVEGDVLVDGHKPVAVLRDKVKAENASAWSDVEVSLDAFAGQLVDLELRVKRGTTNGRVLLGDPEIVVPTIAPEPVAQAQVVLIVVLSGVDRGELPPYTKEPDPNLERLIRLADQSTVFQNHRAPTNDVPAVMASLVTGLTPREHTLTDLGNTLPNSVPTIFDAARSASVTTAFFTSVPESFRPFGLTRGVEHVVEISPVNGDRKTALGEAQAWIDSNLVVHPTEKMLVVVHTRAGHPPWDVTGKQLDALPPPDYSGNIQPRRAGQELFLFRKHHKKDLPEHDLTRIRALHQIGLGEDDHAFGQLLDSLDGSSAEDKTLVIVTSDLSSGMSTLFSDSPPPNEASLGLPLYVRFPKHALAGRSVTDSTGVGDVAITALASLGITPLPEMRGQDLESVASGLATTGTTPSVAVSGEWFITRWDALALVAKPNAEPLLCDVSVDPTCTFDRRSVMPLASTALMRAFAASEAELAKKHLPPAQAATLDNDTLAALRVWGAME